MTGDSLKNQKRMALPEIIERAWRVQRESGIYSLPRNRTPLKMILASNRKKLTIYLDIGL